MNLLTLLKSSPDIEEKSIRQVIAIAGSGKLADDSETSREFRAFLSNVNSSTLARYATECLDDSFQDSGFALQDIINEVGRRLGFHVENGRYRGRQGVPGHDGLWTLPNEHLLVVEVKTTDAYRIDLNVMANYRRELINRSAATEDTSSVLIVVGRADTGDLEAQVRGSKSAWEMRLISVDGLLRLMTLKESIEDPDALRRIYELLIPREFTKLDEIVDLVFSTAEDVKDREAPEETDDDEGIDLEKPPHSPKFVPVNFNELVARSVARITGLPLLRRTKASFSTADESVRVICMASKRHVRPTNVRYWFAFHPHQLKWLQDAKSGFLALGCGSPELIVLIPIIDFTKWLDGLGKTIREGRSYWHIDVHESDGHLTLSRRAGHTRVDLSPFVKR